MAIARREDKNWHLKWAELAGGGFECQMVEGDHLEMLEDPNVESLAVQLRACVDSALAKD